MMINKTLHYIIVGGLFLLLLTPLFVSTSLFFPFITGKAFFFRILVEVIFALWLWLIWREPAYRPQKSWITFALVGLILMATLATLFGQNPYHSFWSNFERMDGLISYLHFLVYFLVLSSMLRSEKIWQYFFHASIGVSLVIAGYSLAQIAGAVPISQGRLDATLGNAIYLAAYMLFHVFLTAFLLFRHRERRWWRYAYLPIILLQIYILYRTATRGTILGLLVGIFVSALILLVKRRSDLKIRRAALGVLILLAVIVGGFWFGRHSDFVRNSPVLSRFASISTTETTTESRLTIWQMSLRGFREHPLLGWGPENYGLVFNKYYEPKLWRQEQWFDRSHNIFLDWLIDAGVLGLAAYLSIFVVALYYLWRSRQTIITKSLFTGLLAAYLVNNFFAFDNLTSYLLFLSFLAYIHYHSLSTREPTDKNQALGEGDRILQGLILFFVIVVFSGGIYYLNFRPLSVSAKIIKALSPASSATDPGNAAKNKAGLFQDIFSADTFGSREAAEQFANQAMQIARSSQVGNDVKQEIASAAVKHLNREIEKAPQDARLRLVLGGMLANLGQSQLALEPLNRALALSPKKQTIMFQLAGAYFGLGDKKKALEIAEQAFRLDENFPEARKFYALMLIYNGNPKSSDQILAGGEDIELDERFINAYVEVKRYDLVLKLWQDKVKNNPADIQGRFSLAAAYLSTGERVAAIKELQRAGELDASVKSQADSLINEIRAGRNPTSQ